MDFSFRGKVFFLFIFYGLVLVFAGQFIVSYMDKESIKKELLDIGAYQAEFIDKEFKANVENFDTKLSAIKESKLFQQYYQEHNINRLQEYLLDISKTSNFIMQLRLIDMQGNEIVRIDRAKESLSPYLVKKEKLQNKKHRYYFEAISKLQEGQYWYSKLDVNMEHGRIQKPIVPVLRVGTPFYFQGHKEALLIINIFMDSFLGEISHFPMFDVYLIDKDAQVILSPKKEENFSRYLGVKEKTFPFMDEIKKILHTQEYRGKDFYSKKLSLTNGEDITIVLVPKSAYLSALVQKNYEQILYVVLAIILFSFPLSYVLSLVPARLNTKVERLNRALKREQNEQQLLLSLFDLSDSVLFKWKNDEEWSVNFVSKSVEKLLGYSKADFESSRVSYSSCIYEDDLALVMEEVEEAIKTKKFFFEHKPYRVKTRDGKLKWILENTVVVRNSDGDITHFLGYLIDITELKEKESILEKIAKTDPLTQIYNRIYIDEVLLNQYYRYYRNSEECSVVMMDIDHFKSINDTFGHLAGDKVLKEFAKIIQHSIRESDILGRWGGEEFLLILPHTNLADAELLAQKIHNIVQNHQFPIIGKLTASFGLSSFRFKTTVEDVVDEADKALYKAKEAGRNTIRVYKA